MATSSAKRAMRRPIARISARTACLFFLRALTPDQAGRDIAPEALLDLAMVDPRHCGHDGMGMGGAWSCRSPRAEKREGKGKQRERRTKNPASRIVLMTVRKMVDGGPLNPQAGCRRGCLCKTGQRHAEGLPLTCGPVDRAPVCPTTLLLLARLAPIPAPCCDWCAVVRFASSSFLQHAGTAGGPGPGPAHGAWRSKLLACPRRPGLESALLPFCRCFSWHMPSRSRDGLITYWGAPPGGHDWHAAAQQAHPH